MLVSARRFVREHLRSFISTERCGGTGPAYLRTVTEFWAAVASLDRYMTQLQRRASGFQLENRGELTLLTLCTLGAAFFKNAYGRGRHWDVSPAPTSAAGA